MLMSPSIPVIGIGAGFFPGKITEVPCLLPG
jgi:hypothetical protein